AHRPEKRVLVDYNQNAWGRTLASVYSVRPKPQATVSTPVTWDEVKRGIEIEDFRIDNVRRRLAKVGDLWSPVLPSSKPRADLTKFLTEAESRARPPPPGDLRSGTLAVDPDPVRPDLNVVLVHRALVREPRVAEAALVDVVQVLLARQQRAAAD